MQKTTIITFAVLTSAIIFFSCKKNDSPAKVINAMAATINSQAFAANHISSSTSLFSSDTFLYITGIDTISGKKIELQVLKYMGQTGTFSISGSNPTAAATFTHDTSGLYSYAVSGQIVLTEISPNLKGTFYFTTADTTIITNGTFTADGGL